MSTDTNTETTVRLPNGKVTDLAKSKFGIILSCDGTPTGYDAAFTLGERVDVLQDRDDVEVYGATWEITESGASDLRYLADESPEMVTCPDCSTLVDIADCETCGGEGEINDSPWAEAITVKAVALLDWDGLRDMWCEEGGMGTCHTMGAMGMPTPDDAMAWYTPAFAIESGDPHAILSIYVTPYLYTSEGEPLYELDEADFDAAVEAIERIAR